MKRLNLDGAWLLSYGDNITIDGHLPGSTYLDLMANGLDDPFRELNETKSTDIAKQDFTYSRSFEISETDLGKEKIEFVGDGIDTLCDIYINDKLIGNCANIHRTYRFDVKNYVAVGKNDIKLIFHDPYKYFEDLQEKDPLPTLSIVKGIGHIRKTQSNFGWDWGPALAPAGVTRSIGLEFYDERIEDVYIRQFHDKYKEDGTVSLDVTLTTDSDKLARLILTDPDGNKKEYADENRHWSIEIDNPKLWWSNGLGQQPLYQIDVILGDNIDSRHYEVGLRTVILDTHKDEDGEQFKFIINDVPLFIHGADWIPADSFITRADKETIDFYIAQMKNAGMNLVRVWGGGTYETEYFYDACDRNGILVWQDFAFACNAYPFYNDEFVENVHQEVIDNVKRLRHRTSLAIWCGNNENEEFAMMWKKDKKINDSNIPFYYFTLGPWVNELDPDRPFWPGSPSSGHFGGKIHSLKPGKITGDTHLWQIWHGMHPIESYRDYPTRMCTEFGMESMPSMKAIRSITDNPNPQLLDPVMLLHQKSDSGNEKMLFYLLAKYRNPAKFEDFVYLSQLVQSGGLRFASDTWRRNLGKQNGAVYWQMNDCWPVASWSAIDYLRQPKAVLYHAKQFNKMLSVINDYYKNHLNLYIVNEYPSEYRGTLSWQIKDFSGNIISEAAKDVTIGAVKSENVIPIKFKDVLKGRNKKDVYIQVRLSNEEGIQDENAWLLVPDRDASLPKVDVKYTVTINADCESKSTNIAEFEFSSDKYARYVFLEMDEINAPWSDNFFDIMPGASKKVSVEIPSGITEEAIRKGLTIKTLTDVTPKTSAFNDRWTRFKFMIQPKNIGAWFVFKFLI